MRFISILLFWLPFAARAQFQLSFAPDVPVTQGGSPLYMPWAGGLNFCQFSSIDIDLDGDLDIFIFDRSGDEVIILRNDGAPGAPWFTPTREYDTIFPFSKLTNWVLLRDYNCDGKADIFAYDTGGFVVYKNTSSPGLPSFELQNPAGVGNLVHSNYQPTFANIYVSQVDVPAIEDVDNDGDLDVVTFSIFGSYLDYHRNLSMETYGNCDSLNYEVRNRCWGFFSENFSDNTVTLNNPCTYNVPNPEMPVVIEPWNAETRAEELGMDEAGTAKSAAHAGSTILLIDLDGDHVKDLLLGDISFNNLVALWNGGTVAEALMVVEEDDFPNADVSVGLDIFPGAYYVDVTNDGIRDLLVSPNSTTLAENKRSVWLYRNDGTDASPIFHKQSEDQFQGGMLDFGEGAYPVAFDHNGDGLMDLVVGNFGYYMSGGNYPGKLALLLNTGTTTQPAFALVDEDYMGLSGIGLGQAMYPGFGDVDGDGDLDMYIGDLQGHLHFFRNVATGAVASFQLAQLQVNSDAGGAIDVGQFATPQFFDVNNDGKIDLLVGERNGNVNYYRNSGTMTAPTWHLERDSLGELSVSEWWNITGYSVPVMFLNDAGEKELLVGSESGWIHHYGGIDGNLNGTFTLLDSTWQGIKEGWRSSLALYDFTGDGLLDVVTGNYRGGLAFYRNDFGVSTVEPQAVGPHSAFSLLPNPSAGNTWLVLQVTPTPGMRMSVFDATGRLVAEALVLATRSELPSAEWVPGLYTVRISDGAQQWTRRLVVQR